ncbi:MAG: ABC transporter ATP-binding protein [Coriobacteriia bacterium]|nr:ABC transporter ATP-binding protein [Coriobacteriia bacterium]
MTAEASDMLAPPTAPAVRGEGIKVVYRRRTAVDVPSIEVAAGKTYALLGASGAGKSTLLRVLGLLERPAEGRVFIDGVEASGKDLATRRTIAAVFQKPYLLRATVGANVGYGLKLRRVPKREREQRLSDALARVGLAGWEGRSALTLSGGEAQRVALARALVLRPRILLLDEPLSYMDPLLKRSLTLEFAEILKSERVTALYVTHDRDEAAVVADRIGIMRDGRLVSEGDPETVLTLPTDEWVASFLDAEAPAEGLVATSGEGVMTLACGDAMIIAVGDLPLGSRVLVGVPSEDVLLFEHGVQIPRTSARNQLDGVVSEVAPAGAAMRITVAVGDLRLASTVSRSSAADLRLAPGSLVTLLFKATAVRVRPRDTIAPIV